MHRLTRDQLTTNITVAIKTAPNAVQAKLRSKLATDRDEGARRLAEVIATELDSRTHMVIATEMVVIDRPCDARPGVWGIDEPDPCPGQAGSIREQIKNA